MQRQLRRVSSISSRSVLSMAEIASTTSRSYHPAQAQTPMLLLSISKPSRPFSPSWKGLTRHAPFHCLQLRISPLMLSSLASPRRILPKGSQTPSKAASILRYHADLSVSFLSLGLEAMPTAHGRASRGRNACGRAIFCYTSSHIPEL